MRFYRGSNCYLRTNPRANLHQKSAPPLESDGGADEASLTLRRFQLRANFSDTGSRPCAAGAFSVPSVPLVPLVAVPVPFQYPVPPAPPVRGSGAGLVPAITAVAAVAFPLLLVLATPRGATLAAGSPITVPEPLPPVPP